MFVKKSVFLGGILATSIFTLCFFANERNAKISSPNHHHHHHRHNYRPEFDSSTDWHQPKIPEHLLNASQSDPELINHIRSEWIIPPSTERRSLKRPEVLHYSASNQSSIVDGILGGRTNGFFVECGAADGETISNSLFFEKSRNWSGVLIEGYEPWFRKLLRLRRRAYAVGACLSPVKSPVLTEFVNIGYGGGMINYMKDSHLNRFGGKNRLLDKTEAMQCLPLYSILRAIGAKHVDYFSLDIEGAELEVIKTLPLDEIIVDVFTIEYIVGDVSKSRTDSVEKFRAIKDYLVGRYGYEVFHVNNFDDVYLRRKNM
ncbi:hypothetical protein LSH36_352g03034 [Paralvinella palmiformis]|uniref:Methyltransferase FkbM domain-containing protein n=1 Tax=Paralvinella palmiformis TaxID=53620 RepID=A0AAD9JG30_9ANNE|nr:hypothetical protein LSH36_352g03034 [Paralvinella palmiformis]